MSTDTLPQLLEELDAFVALDGGDLSVVEKAAAALRAQAEEVERLRAALLPFVDAPVEYLAGGVYEVTVNGRDLLAARAAMEKPHE